MPIYLLPSLLLAIIVVGYTPGPANLYALACCLKYGRRKARKMWRGLCTGFCIDLVLMVLLTHLLGEMMGHYVIYLKYIGVAYATREWTMRKPRTAPSSRACSCS